MSYTRVWCFTINNPANNELPNGWLGVQDAIWQLEQGESGTLHLQGFVRFDKNKRLSALKKLDATAHWEVCKAPAAAVDYCSKEDTRIFGPWTIGSPKGKQGQRSDIDEAVARIAAGDAIVDIISDIPSALRYRNHLLSHRQDVLNNEAKRQRREKNVEAVLKPWQQELGDMLSLAPDGRHFVYIFERTGNAGKSWMGHYLESTKGALCLRPGKIADLAYAYEREPIVVFDIVRTNVEGSITNVYGFTESLLDGSIFSPKYGSVVKTFDPPHVVIFSNAPPDYTAMSKDRYVVYEIANDTLVSYEEERFVPLPECIFNRAK